MFKVNERHDLGLCAAGAERIVVSFGTTFLEHNAVQADAQVFDGVLVALHHVPLRADPANANMEGVLTKRRVEGISLRTKQDRFDSL